MAKTRKKDIVVTLGDPAGCGPRITFQAINSLIKKPINFWVVGDNYIAEQCFHYRRLKNKINFIDVSTPGINQIKKGCISKLAGAASLDYLQKALKLSKKNNFKSLVTAPVSKEAVSLAQPGFSGHTEFLANYFGKTKVVMMMVSPELRVALLTRHLCLGEVGAFITPGLVADTISLVFAFLKGKMNIVRPKIALASFNPHAGIETFMGEEEKKIKKGIAKSGKKVYGPYPPDSLFSPTSLAKFDCLIAAYHDQGMIPFKMLSFRFGVNVTAGLPLIRTSPDHGVAFDLVKNSPSSIFFTSMQAAIVEAYRLS